MPGSHSDGVEIISSSILDWEEEGGVEEEAAAGGQEAAEVLDYELKVRLLFSAAPQRIRS